MKGKNQNRRHVALALLSLLLMFPLRAQPEGDFRVRWIAEYPGGQAEQKKSLGGRLSRIVFGKKYMEVVRPFNVLADDPGSFIILDQGAGSLFEVRKGRGTAIRATGKEGQIFPSLVGICTGNEGSILFTDSRMNRVSRIREGHLGIFCDSLVLEQPTGIACDKVSGQVWITETGAHRISRFSMDGTLLGRLGGRGTGAGQFNFPTFIWIDQEGRIFVVDSMNHRIQVFNRDGDFLTAFGKAGDATGYMARPKGIATDSKGHIYVADALFHAIQVFDLQGSFLYSFGCQGQGQGEFWMPAGIFIDEQDHIYVADSYNSRVQIFKLEERK